MESMKIVNLIDYKDIGGSSDNITLFKSFNDIIKSKLEQGLFNNELIYTQDLRSIGKTYQLIEFAKKHDYAVVVNNKGLAKRLIQEYNYLQIFGQYDIILQNFKSIVVDECVDVLKLINGMNCKLVTGYVTDKDIFKQTDSKDNELSFKDEQIKILKEEIEQLNKSRKKALNDDRQSDYKLLINNYKQTVEILQAIEDINNFQAPTINFTVDFNNSNIEEIINELNKFNKLTREGMNNIGESFKRLGR